MSSAVVITGASGFLGRHLLTHFLDAGRDVVALSRDPSRLDDMTHPHLRVVATDYGPEVAGQIPLSSTVIHLAAQRNVPIRRASTFMDNVTVAESVVRAARERKAARFAHVSTALVLGPGMDEREATAPLQNVPAAMGYVASRIAGLLAVERIAGDGLPLVTLLPTIIFGPDHPRAPNRIATHVRRILRMPVHLTIGTGSSPRNLVYINDVVCSIARAAELEWITGRQLVSGENVTQEQLELEVRTAAGLPPAHRIAIPRGVALTAARAIDALLRFDRGSGWTSRLETLLAPWCFRPGVTVGGCPVTPFEEGVTRTVLALRSPGRE